VPSDPYAMGVDMVTMTLPLPLGREPDWEAAALAIRDLRLDVVWDADELYPWEEWLAETENLPGSEAAFVALRAAQWQLHRHACALRGAIDHGWPAELVCIPALPHARPRRRPRPLRRRPHVRRRARRGREHPPPRPRGRPRGGRRGQLVGAAPGVTTRFSPTPGRWRTIGP
jgi:hypothetical protein